MVDSTRQLVTGYMHPGYAQSLNKFGTPRELPHSQGWVLERWISGFSSRDALGSYPLFACKDWSKLQIDLEDIGHNLVSIALVTDPFGEYDTTYLESCFKDVVIPFKEHYIVELSRPLDSYVSNHHRRYARKALRNLYVERCEDPVQLIDEWTDLYDDLIKRHNIKGIPAFSHSAFKKQLNIPGIVMFRAVYRETTIGMLLWYIQHDIGYYHLGAYNALGYEMRASFALFWTSIEYFAANQLSWLNLGAGAGVKKSGEDGLSRFKRGWSTGTKTAYFCGRIFDLARYTEITEAKGICDTEYFPAYRKGEFG